MGLIIGVERGQDFFVGDTQVIVTDIFSERSFRLTVVRDGGDEHFEVDDSKKVAILHSEKFVPGEGMVSRPLVWAQAGNRGSKVMARVMVDAPRNIEILRGHLYRKGGEGEYQLSPEAEQDAAELMAGCSQQQVIDMVRQSAKCTHVHGNRRYEDFVFNMDGRVVMGIALFNAPARSHTLYDDCPSCLGRGCNKCDDGQVVIGTH